MPASAAPEEAVFPLSITHMEWCDRNIWSFTQHCVTAGHSAGRGDRHRAWLKELILFGSAVFLLVPAVLPRWDIPDVTRAGVTPAELVCGASAPWKPVSSAEQTQTQSVFPHGTHTTHFNQHLLVL